MIALGREEVAALLEPAALIDAVATALADLSAGSASVPPRIAAFTPLGLLGAMVGYVPSLDVLAAKLVAVFPQNAAMPTHRALVAVFDPRTGAPQAILDGEEITAQRTAAVSALATRLLARVDAEVLAIVGTGVQAASHARYPARETVARLSKHPFLYPLSQHSVQRAEQNAGTRKLFLTLTRGRLYKQPKRLALGSFYPESYARRSTAVQRLGWPDLKAELSN